MVHRPTGRRPVDPGSADPAFVFFGSDVIESALVFTLGALSAGLLAILVFPAFTRRAARLARRDAETRLPRSLNEIAAAKDGVRAVFAARTARVEVENAFLSDRLTEERMARAEDGLQLSAARAEVQALADALRESEERLAATRDRLLDRDEAIARLTVERRDLERRFAVLAERARAAEIQSLEAEEALDALRQEFSARAYASSTRTAADRPGAARYGDDPMPDDDLVTDVDYVEVDPAPPPASNPMPPRRPPVAVDAPVRLSGLRAPFAASLPAEAVPDREPTGRDGHAGREWSQAEGGRAEFARVEPTVSAPAIAMPEPDPAPADAPGALVEASADSLTLAHPTRLAVVLEDGTEPDAASGSPTTAEGFVAPSSATPPQADWSGRIDEIADRIRRFRAAVGQTRARPDQAAEPAAPADARQDA